MTITITHLTTTMTVTERVRAGVDYLDTRAWGWWNLDLDDLDMSDPERDMMTLIAAGGYGLLMIMPPCQAEYLGLTITDDSDSNTARAYTDAWAAALDERLSAQARGIDW